MSEMDNMTSLKRKYDEHKKNIFNKIQKISNEPNKEERIRLSNELAEMISDNSYNNLMLALTEQSNREHNIKLTEKVDNSIRMREEKIEEIKKETEGKIEEIKKEIEYINEKHQEDHDEKVRIFKEMPAWVNYKIERIQELKDEIEDNKKYLRENKADYIDQEIVEYFLQEML